jgi:hypothetical protein
MSRLDTAVLFILSSPQLMSDSDDAVNSILTVIENMHETLKSPFHQVAGLESDQPDQPTTAAEAMVTGVAMGDKAAEAKVTMARVATMNLG